MMVGMDAPLKRGWQALISKGMAEDTAALTAYVPHIAARETPDGFVVSGEPRWRVLKRAILTDDEIEAGWTLDDPQMLVVEWDVTPDRFHGADAV